MPSTKFTGGADRLRGLARAQDIHRIFSQAINALEHASDDPAEMRRSLGDAYTLIAQAARDASQVGIEPAPLRIEILSPGVVAAYFTNPSLTPYGSSVDIVQYTVPLNYWQHRADLLRWFRTWAAFLAEPDAPKTQGKPRNSGGRPLASASNPVEVERERLAVAYINRTPDDPNDMQPWLERRRQTNGDVPAGLNCLTFRRVVKRVQCRLKRQSKSATYPPPSDKLST